MRSHPTHTVDREISRGSSTALAAGSAVGVLALTVAFAAGCPDRARNEHDGSAGETDAAEVDATRDTVDASDGGGDSDLDGGEGETGETGEVGDTGVAGETGDVAEPISCDHPEAPAGCEPRRPKGTPSEECPSGRYAGEARFAGKGICLPESPELPRLEDWSCPDDWRAAPAFDPDGTEGDALAEIDPFATCRPPDLPQNCSGGNAARLGKTDCLQLGSSCPTGDRKWPSETDLRSAAPASFSGEVVYVDTTRSSGGDGSRSAPHATVETALSNASSGGIVALSEGEHRTNVDLDRSVALVGACATETSLRPPSSASSDDAAIEIVGPTPTAVANLRVAAEGHPGVEVASSLQNEVTLSGVAIADASPDGLRLGSSSTVEAEKLAIRRTTSDDQNSGGRGIRVGTDAVLELRDGMVRKNAHTGILASGSRRVELTDVAVTGTQGGDKSLGQGRGVAVRQGTTFDATRLLLEANRTAGLTLRGAETAGTVDLVSVTNTRPSPSTKWGFGVEIKAGARLEATRLAARRNHAVGLVAAGGATEVSVQQGVVAATEPRPFDTPLGGNGAAIRRGADVTLESILLDRNTTRSIHLQKGSLELTDAAVTRTRSPREGAFNLRGIELAADTSLRADRLYLADHLIFGLLANGTNSPVDLTDTTIVRTSPTDARALPGSTIGLSVGRGSSVSARRLELESNGTGFQIEGPDTTVEFDDVSSSESPVITSGDKTSGGIGGYVQGGLDFVGRRLLVSNNPRINLGTGGYFENEEERGVSNVELHDLVVRGSDEPAEELGYTGAGGLQILDTEIQVDGALVERARGAGITAFGAGSIDLTDAVVTETQPAGEENRFGYGLYAFGADSGFEITGERLVFRKSRYAGLVAAEGTSITLADARITGTRPTESNGEFGDGIYLFGAPGEDEFTVERSMIRANARAGILASERTVRISESLITENRIGLVREGETDVEVTNSLLRGNEVEDERCQRQCYEEPPEPSTVSP